MSLFGDGMAASVIYPGVDLKLEETVFEVVQDVKGVLAAHMTYEHLVDREQAAYGNEHIWQQSEDGKTEWIVGPTPPEGKSINMLGGETGSFFKQMALKAAIELDTKHRARHPDRSINLVYAHHPNKTINNNVAKNLERRGHALNIPWVDFTSNSSAAESSKVFTQLLEKIHTGDIVAGFAYGAGGSVAAYTAEVGSRWTHRDEGEKRIFEAAHPGQAE
jgi:3-oxoacyl-[acyl-carrier-protein] synthase III